MLLLPLAVAPVTDSGRECHAALVCSEDTWRRQGATRVRTGGLVVPRPACAGSLVRTFGFSVWFVGGGDGTFGSIGQVGSR